VTFAKPGSLFEIEEPPFDYVVCVDKNAKSNSSLKAIFELKACDFFVQEVTEKFSTSYSRRFVE
jgi:hypothetical protein